MSFLCAKFSLFFFSSYRNSFPIYASTLGTEETSEADDVFNEKADLTLFRDSNKLKSSHENEVKMTSNFHRNLRTYSLFCDRFFFLFYLFSKFFFPFTER